MTFQIVCCGDSLNEISGIIFAKNSTDKSFFHFVYSDQIAVRQSQVDKLYAGLKDLAQERRSKLDEVLKLYKLSHEIEDLMQWIAEREVIASSHELGQDFEHVTVSLFFTLIMPPTLKNCICLFVRSSVPHSICDTLPCGKGILENVEL